MKTRVITGVALRISLEYKYSADINYNSWQVRLEDIPTSKIGIMKRVREWSKTWKHGCKIRIKRVALEGYTDRLEFDDIKKFEDSFVNANYIGERFC